MRWILTVAVLVWCTSAAAQIANPSFETGPEGATPPGWTLADYASKAGYSFTTESGDALVGGKSAHFSQREGGGGPSSLFGLALQEIDVAPLRGHWVRYSAAAKTKTGAAMLWLRIIGADGKPTRVEAMADRPIRGRDWQIYSVEAYILPDAKSLSVGFLIKQGGEAQFDSVGLTDLGAADTAPSPEAKAYLDKAIGLLKQHHINADSADWAALERRAYTQAAAARTPRDTHSAIQMVIQSLGERHSALIPPQESPLSPAMAGSRETDAPVPQPLPVGRMAGRVAIISLGPWRAPNFDPAAAGKPYQDAITSFEKNADGKGVCGWIVDLRGHSGGDMWPGMRGLAPILGSGPYGAFVYKEKRAAWNVQADVSLTAGNAPVAVLLGPQTGSSGELIAIALSGRPDSRSFGQPTKGLTTANRRVLLDDGASLLITAATAEDRTGRRFSGPIQPDVVAPLQDSEAAAEAWLNERGCR